MKEQKYFIFDIPKGVEDGEIFCVKIGRLGEVCVKVHIEDSKYFIREGADVISDAYISKSTSKFGGTIRINGLYGNLNLQIPAGTALFSTFKLDGQGFLKRNTHDKEEYGDHFVNIIKIVNRKRTAKRHSYRDY